MNETPRTGCCEIFIYTCDRLLIIQNSAFALFTTYSYYTIRTEIAE